jgi:hypothetical protein
MQTTTKLDILYIINKIKPICANEVKLRRVLFILERQSNGLAFAVDMAADMLLLRIQTRLILDTRITISNKIFRLVNLVNISVHFIYFSFHLL